MTDNQTPQPVRDDDRPTIAAEPTPRATALQWAGMDGQQRHDLWSVRPLAELAELSALMLDAQRALFAEAAAIRAQAESVDAARQTLRAQLLSAHAIDDDELKHMDRVSPFGQDFGPNGDMGGRR